MLPPPEFAHGSGRIELPEAKGNTRYFRYAPSFVPGEDSREPVRASPYTAKTVAEFLGWVTSSGEPQYKVENALATGE